MRAFLLFVCLSFAIIPVLLLNGQTYTNSIISLAALVAAIAICTGARRKSSDQSRRRWGIAVLLLGLVVVLRIADLPASYRHQRGFNETRQRVRRLNVALQTRKAVIVPPSSSTAVDGVEVFVTATKEPGSARIGVKGGTELATLDLPQSAGRITDLRICPWMNAGVAIAVEATNEETKEISYHWATTWVTVGAGRVGKPTGAEFLRSMVNYDMGAITNTQGDTIYMLLSRLKRTNFAQIVDGYAFIHNCPVGPSKGSVIPFEAVQRW